jgi:ketosteroid isomerase-like protein
MQKPAEQELRNLERRYWDAIQQKDEATAMELSDEQCVVVGAQGVGEIDRERLGQMLKQASYEVTRYQVDDLAFHIRKITDDVAIVAYEVREDLIVDGKPESLAAFDASVWVRRGDAWLCALHTESLKGDPFGRRDVDRLSGS